MPRGRATGVDRDPRYVAHATRRARDEGLDDAEFVHGDAMRRPFEDGRFDVVGSGHLRRRFDDPAG